MNQNCMPFLLKPGDKVKVNKALGSPHFNEHFGDKGPPEGLIDKVWTIKRVVKVDECHLGHEDCACCWMFALLEDERLISFLQEEVDLVLIREAV